MLKEPTVESVIPNRYAADRTEVDTLFLKSVDQLKIAHPFLLESGIGASIIQKWIQYFGKRKCANIDYDLYGRLFNQAFFLKNLYKNVFNIHIASRHEAFTEVNKVVDIGSGAGVASLAWYLVFESLHLKAILIDRSETQLQLARAILRSFGIENLEFHHKILPSKRLSGGFRLISYWLCEQDLDRFDDHQLFNLLGENALVTDYSHVISAFQERIPATVSTRRWSFSVQISPKVEPYLQEKEVDINGCYCWV